MQSIQNLLVLRRHPRYTSIQVCRIFIDVVLSVVGGHCSSYLSLLQLKTSLGYIYATSAICGHLWKLKSAMKEALSCSSWLLCCVKYVHTLQTDGAFLCTCAVCTVNYGELFFSTMASFLCKICAHSGAFMCTVAPCTVHCAPIQCVQLFFSTL